MSFRPSLEASRELRQVGSHRGLEAPPLQGLGSHSLRNQPPELFPQAALAWDPLPGSHLHQDVLALPREQVLEPIKGEVVSQAQGRAASITHVVRTVPLPVLTDTGDRRWGVRVRPPDIGAGPASGQPGCHPPPGSLGNW